MKLYQLTADYESAFNALIDPETGEMAENAVMILDSLQTDIREKGVAVATFIRNMDSDIEALENEEKRLAARRKAFVKQKEWLKSYLQTNMEKTGISEISCPFFKIKTRKCPPKVDIVEEDMIPDEYKIIKQEICVDKTRIKNDIQSGIIVPGAELKQGTTITIK